MEKCILFLLRTLALFPLGVLYILAGLIYFILYHIVGYRKKVVRQNLMEAFPEKSEAELKKIEREYYRFLSEVIVETVKLLHISPEEMKRRVEVVNPGIVSDSVEKGRCAALLLGHYGNWEWVQEISRYFPDNVFKTSIYHPLKNKMADRVYMKMRSHWGVKILPQRHAVKTLLDRDNRPWICGFIADNRPDTFNEDNVTPFLNHMTSFIYGPEVIGRKVGADYFFLQMERVRRGYYRITFRKLTPSAEELPYPYMRAFWKELEEEIKRKPACWLWSHRRWKRDRIILPVPEYAR